LTVSQKTKADSALVTVWWLWMAAALLASALPLEWAIAVLSRGLASVQSLAIDGGGFALLSGSALLTLLALPPLSILSPVYAFLFWNRRSRGAHLSARFWLPIYGSALVVVMLSLMVLSVRAGAAVTEPR
jgi:hypothetical protein